CRHVRQGRSHLTCCLRYRLRSCNMQSFEALAARLMQDSNQVDDMVGAGDSLVYRPVIADIRLHGMHLAHGAQKLGMDCGMRIPTGHTDPKSTSRKGAHDIAPDKTGTAENRHEPGFVADHGQMCLTLGLTTEFYALLNRFHPKGKGRKRVE